MWPTKVTSWQNKKTPKQKKQKQKNEILHDYQHVAVCELEHMKCQTVIKISHTLGSLHGLPIGFSQTGECGQPPSEQRFFKSVPAFTRVSHEIL